MRRPAPALRYSYADGRGTAPIAPSGEVVVRQ